MGFEIIQNGTSIEITEIQDGQYVDFNSVRTEIIRREKTLVIKEIKIKAGEISYSVPNGLEKLLSGHSFEDISNTEGLEDESKEQIKQQQLEAAETLRQSEDALELAKISGNWENIPDSAIKDAISKVILTTSMFVANREIIEEIDIITYECAYGMNFFKDLFASVRDIVGGRSKAVEKVLRDARVVAMQGLREEALKSGADGVIAVDLDYSELSGGNKNGMLVAIASGTAVKLGEKKI